MSFLPLFRKAATEALGYRRANNALHNLMQCAPEEQAAGISRVCNEISEQMTATNNLSLNRALENLFSNLSKMDFVQKKHAALVRRIQEILNSDKVAKKEGLQVLLADNTVQKIFAEAAHTFTRQQSDFQKNEPSLGEESFGTLAGMLKQSAAQIAYSPEGIVISSLVDLFFQMFDMAEMAQGKEALFTRKAQSSDDEKPRTFMPMPR